MSEGGSEMYIVHVGGRGSDMYTDVHLRGGVGPGIAIVCAAVRRRIRIFEIAPLGARATFAVV